MGRTRAKLIAVLWWIPIAVSHAASLPAEQAFEQWLAAYNAADSAALTKFYESRLGYPDIDYVLDTREETGGLDLLEIERNEPLTFVARMRERDFAAFQRLTFELEDASSGKLRVLDQTPEPLATPQAIAALDAFAGKLAARDRYSGVFIVEQNGKRLYARAFGLADREGKKPVRLDTPFFMASQGKMFTGVAVLQLVEAGKVALDDPIGKYLTDYPNKVVAQKVTVRHLLTHRGGTGDIGILRPEEGGNRAWVRTIGDLIKLNGSRPPAFEPGTEEAYSNYGFILLGALVEKVSGRSYYDYVSEHVFRPAGMNATGFPTRDGLAGVAIPYTKVNDKIVNAGDTLPWRGLSAGGGVSTAQDELKFVASLKEGKLIAASLVQEATRRQTPWYGYGFISSEPDDYPHWGHGGGAPGMSTVLAVYPTNGVTMVCLSNRDGPVCDRLALNLHYHLAPGAARR